MERRQLVRHHDRDPGGCGVRTCGSQGGPTCRHRSTSTSSLLAPTATSHGCRSTPSPDHRGNRCRRNDVRAHPIPALVELEDDVYTAVCWVLFRGVEFDALLLQELIASRNRALASRNSRRGRMIRSSLRWMRCVRPASVGPWVMTVVVGPPNLRTGRSHAFCNCHIM